MVTQTCYEQSELAFQLRHPLAPFFALADKNLWGHPEKLIILEETQSRVAAPKFVTQGWLTRVVEMLQVQPHARLLAIAPDNKIPWAKGHLHY